uniref:RING-type E3 ubiquitin transferase n=1 Tax=Rhinolophus ferrumequinum TaxID=59479 RepID=A0A671DHZ6_RHIFE
MENSDSDDEDESTAMVQNQMDRLVREEDFYRFVNNLNDEDYKLMRDNDLLGNPGESTEEELLRRLQQLKENPLQNVHENTGDTSDDESSAQSLLNWLLSSEETDESVTSEHTEHQSCRELSQVSPNNDFTFNSETYFHLNNDNSNLENEYEPPTRLPRGENIENRQSHVENLCSESTFTRPSRSEQSITEALSEVPLTRGQRRARSRSPDHRRTRARSENWSPPHSTSEIFQRHYQGDASSPTSEQPVVNATERLTRTQLQETLRQQITGHDLQNRDLFATPRTRNRESPVQRESSQDTTRGDVSHRLRQISPTIFLDSELARVHPGAYSESESIASRTQITSETSINTFTLESEQGGPRPMFSYSEQADMRAHVSTISIPIHTTLNTGLNDTTSVATQSNPWQAMTDFSDLSNLMNNDNDLEPCVSPSSQNVEKRESPTGRESCDSRSSGANSDSDHDSHSPSALISSSNSSYRSPFNSSPTSLSPVSFSQTRQHSRSMSPVSFDDSDSWTSLDLDQFFLVSDDQNHSTGLTREQIDNLTVRSFGKNEVLKSCSICIMEYTEGNRLRVLPCSHEYHIHCIDRWLADNSTCPVCRGKVVDSGEGENSN